jgi:DNA-binding NtrC family response regulator
VPARTLSPGARAALLAHPWPGNVRELANLVERVVLLSEGTEITAEMLEIAEPRSQEAAAPRTNGNAHAGNGRGVVEREPWRPFAGAPVARRAWA